MKNRMNHILIGLLWLLAVALGACFWFNTKYGFNIFSLQHWQYLAYMQASNQPVLISFYISFIVVIAVAVFGLYQLLQPRMRKIILPVIDKSPKKEATTIAQPEPPVIKQSHEKSVVIEQKPESAPTTPARPPRLNIPTPVRTSAPVPRVPLISDKKERFDPEQEYADIREIFTSAGFLYKGAPRIKNVQTSVIAIGTDEVLWVGATGVSTPDMQRAIDTLNGIFTDTLEDIEINVNAFIIAPTDNSTSGSIMHFASVDDLRAYINEHPNVPPTEDDVENFDAYSGYIGTVVDYVGKI